jgi:hypothetical protein
MTNEADIEGKESVEDPRRAAQLFKKPWQMLKDRTADVGPGSAMYT